MNRAASLTSALLLSAWSCAALTTACVEEDPLLESQSQQTNTVDCLGMVPEQVTGAPEGTTQLLVGGAIEAIPNAAGPFAAELAEGDRCWFRFAGPFQGTVESIGFDTVNSAILAVNLGGRAYLMQSGAVTFDEGSTRPRASGRYQGVFIPISGDGSAAAIELQGRFDYCHTGVVQDCPYKIEGLLEYPLTLSAPKIGQDVPAEASECRLLIDRETGGAQLDLQIGIWRGLNLAQLFESCADFLDVDQGFLNRNRLTFRVGGVTGPGTHGPYLSRAFDDGAGGEVVLPALEWDVPPAFAFLYTPQAGNTGVCSLIQQSTCGETPCDRSYVRSEPDRTVCTLTITEPDQVSLHCEGVEAHIANLAPFFESGDFELETSCRISYVE